MARAQKTDYFHNYKFHVYSDHIPLALPAGGADETPKEAVARFKKWAESGYLPQISAGFSACTLPEITLDTIEYKEGIQVYKRKFPGNPTVSDVTLSRGLTKNGSVFYNWMKATVDGSEYRANVYIQHFFRGEGIGGDTATEFFTSTRTIILGNAYCSRYRPGSDLDAMGADVSIEELDIVCENFEVNLTVKD